jgi:hypothetical protein
MKLSRILPLVVGSAAAGVFASVAPAHALSITFNLNPTALFNTGLTATGIATFDDSLLIPSTNFVSLVLGPQVLQGFSFNVSNGESFNLTSISAWQLTTDPSNNVVDLNFFNGNGSNGGFLQAFSPLTVRYSSTSGISELFLFAPTAAVPFDIPGGATIPTVGSLFALALMRKAKKSLASKTRITNPVNTVVS